MRITVLFLGLILFFCRCLPAQMPYRYFNNLTQKDGLSNNRVNCILQDKRGFIWIGTNDGLNRFDGKYFTTFRSRPHDSHTISGNLVTCLLEDENDNIWIGTSDGGLSCYDYRLPAQQQFKQFKHIEGDSGTIPSNIINALVQDKNGYLWLATSGRAVIRFNKSTGKFQQPIERGTRTALSLSLDPYGILWVGREGGGILKINTATLKYTSDERYNNLYANIPHASVTSLYSDKEQNIWYGSWDNVLYRYNTRTNKEEIFAKDKNIPWSFNNDDARGFAEDASGNLWIAGKHGGVHIYEKKTGKFYNYLHDPSREGTIQDNSVNCVFIDNKGLIWLGTNKGVSIYNPAQQFFVQVFLPAAKDNITIFDFYKDSEKDLLIASSNGIYIQRDGSDKVEHRPLAFKGVPLAVTHFFNYKSQLYIGTDYSLFMYNKKANKLSLLPGTNKDIVMNKIIDSRVVSILDDSINSHPVLLVSPFGHFMAYYDLDDKKWISRTDSQQNIIRRFNLKDNLIRKFYKASNGSIWLATVKTGLARWGDSSSPALKYFQNNPSKNQTISNNNIWDIVEDAKGNLYVSTYGGGLNYLNTRTSQFFYLPGSSNLLEGLKIDDRNNLWMISNGNLEKYNPSTQSFTSYVLPDLAKSGGIGGNIYKDDKNQMYVAGLNYFIRFKPGEVPDNNVHQLVYFTGFRIFNTSYPELVMKKKIGLKYDQNNFTLEFAAPNFFNGDVQYEYMLENYDKSWNPVGSLNRASYSNLEAGNYVFKVKAANKKGKWSENEASLVIHISPPFWKTWWFYLLCVLAIASAGYAFYLYRINELLARQKIRNKIAQDLHDNVGSTLSSISVYSQVAQIYNEKKESQNLQGILEKIGSASVEMISEMSDTVWAINPRNDNMETILQRMESFSRPLLAGKEIQFDFNYDQGIIHLNFEMGQRKNFYLIFKEAINNAVKYAECSQINVQIKHEKQKIYLRIEDNGKGFDLAQKSESSRRTMEGNGIGNMKRRAAEMNGSCSIESSATRGTIVHLQFPIT